MKKLFKVSLGLGIAVASQSAIIYLIGYFFDGEYPIILLMCGLAFTAMAAIGLFLIRRDKKKVEPLLGVNEIPVSEKDYVLVQVSSDLKHRTYWNGAKFSTDLNGAIAYRLYALACRDIYKIPESLIETKVIPMMLEDLVDSPKIN